MVHVRRESEFEQLPQRGSGIGRQVEVGDVRHLLPMARPDARVAQATNHRNVFLEEEKSVLILWEAEEEDEEEEK